MKKLSGVSKENIVCGHTPNLKSEKITLVEASLQWGSLLLNQMDETPLHKQALKSRQPKYCPKKPLLVPQEHWLPVGPQQCIRADSLELQDNFMSTYGLVEFRNQYSESRETGDYSNQR